jgi:hypothetical protein
MSQQIGSIKHLDHMPKATMALSILNRLVERVKPIMDEHNLSIGTLNEFYDDDDDEHMGWNEGKGEVVMIRLREMADKSKFLPEEEIIDTMLHELTHNRYCDHDGDFESYLQGLRDEYDSKYGPVTWPS